MGRSDAERGTRELIQGYLEGNLKPDEAQALREHLETDPALRDALFEALRTDIMIQEVVWKSEHIGPHCGPVPDSALGNAHQVLGVDSPPDPEKVRQIQLRAEEQLQAFMAKQEQLRRQEAAVSRVGPRIDLLEVAARAQAMLMTFKRLTRTVAVLAVLALVGLGGVRYVLAHRVVATLGKTMHAQWECPPDGNDLRPGAMTLHQGFAEIIFKKGARVLLQAPCQFHLRSSNRMALDEGTLTARVTKEAVGFSVQTPTSTVVDYGTEFGVAANAAQGSEIHVFVGEVAVGTPSSCPARLKRLERGEAAQVTGIKSLQIGDVANRSKLFFRQMPESDQLGIPGKRMNLADIVGGGNGYGTGTQGGLGETAAGTINQFTGLPDDAFRPPLYRDQRRAYDNEHVAHGNTFVPVSRLPYVDAIFVPDGGQAACVISSLGHVFEECPDTDGMSKWNVVNGWRYRTKSPDSGVNSPYLADARGISMHANLGITFDLDRIREGLGEVGIRRFTARAGLPLAGEGDVAEADIWVLVDGQVRFVQQDIRATQMFDIDVPIADNERFLTLVATDSQTRSPAKHPSNFDRCFFAETVLELGLDGKHPSPRANRLPLAEKEPH